MASAVLACGWLRRRRTYEHRRSDDQKEYLGINFHFLFPLPFEAAISPLPMDFPGYPKVKAKCLRKHALVMS